MIDAITREEMLLAKALGENVPDIVPVIRKEMYLAKIAGADIQTPEAITREEMYLDAIANGTEVTIEPITRKEMFYAKALGLVESAPEPITRIENLLNQLTLSGGGFDKYSWDGVFASIKAGTYSTDYAIGDMIPLDLGSEGLINMQIAAFDADDLADSSGKAHISWVAKELLKTSCQYNTSSKCNGWGYSNLRTYLNETIKPMIPGNVLSRIVEVITSGYDYSVSAAASWSDTIRVPSNNDIFSSDSKYGALYYDDASRIKYKVGEDVAAMWCTCSQQGSNQVRRATTSGLLDANPLTVAYGVCLCFCT